MRKGQVEGIGLVIIVLLVLGGLAFFLTHKQTPTHTLDTYTDDQLATHYLGALLAADTPCGPTLAELATDCVKAQAGRSVQHACGISACAYLQPLLANLTNQTFTPQGYRYNLSLTYAYGSATSLIYTTGEGCQGRSQATKGYEDLVIHPLPGMATMTFALCN